MLYKAFYAQPWRTPPLNLTGEAAASAFLKLKAMKVNRHRRLVFLDVISRPQDIKHYSMSGWPWRPCTGVVLEGRTFCGPTEDVRAQYFQNVYGPGWANPDVKWGRGSPGT